MTDLGALLDAADPARLLPARRADEAARIAPPLEVLMDRPLEEPAGGLHYLLVADARGVRYGIPAVVGSDGIRRAEPGDGAARALVAAVAPGHAARTERGLAVDQTNELVVVDESVVVKWYLHPHPGNDRGLRRLDLLAAGGFTGTPAVVGRLRAPDGSLAAVVSDFLPGAEDGWDWAVADVRAYARGQVASDDAALSDARALGVLVGRMHLALSAQARAATAGEAAAWRARAMRDAVDADLPPDVRARVIPILDCLGDVGGTPVMPIHGDLHVGQVLRTPDGGHAIIDFDGNPMDESADVPEPAARDVAGMLAALDHVGRVVLHRTEDLDAVGRQRVEHWIERARSAFLASYRATLAEAHRPDLLDDRLLLPLLVQQECREYAYAARYLPHWRYVPDAALPVLLERADVREPL